MSFFQIDTLIFEAINQLSVSLDALNPLMRFLSKQAEYLFYLGIIIYWFAGGRENKKMVIVALAAACIGFGAGEVLSHLFYRDRPFVAMEVHQLISHAANASFPSNHSIGSFVIATAICLYRHKDGILWLPLASLIAFSRIWNGVHFPSDVVGGALIGVISAILVHQLVRHWAFARKCTDACLGLYDSLWSKAGLPRSQNQSSRID
ncbi:undecaprenyl-diphosphatase [Paenibacillus aceti]|uniref:Undecaprenyl-diphosphatase n=1 Tax=Paenibacillus aceti TaxID=1820010 RepID=A0ABQ1VTQ7_9BACL|nr:undecaprenyl-diphosphatase [Paenibacillus aceti]GGF98665.1 undecaprenyl-diphosphatase [Paenibacillus aceti]